MFVTVSGPPGSGKTTVARILAERTGFTLILTGRLFRAMAEERGMSLADFGTLARTDPTLDQELDRRVVAAMRSGVIVEGRLAAVMARAAHKRCLAIYIDAPLEVRAARITEREGGEVSERMVTMQERHNLERARYEEIYGIDPDASEHYDLVLDSSSSPAEAVARQVLLEMAGAGIIDGSVLG